MYDVGFCPVGVGCDGSTGAGAGGGIENVGILRYSLGRDSRKTNNRLNRTSRAKEDDCEESLCETKSRLSRSPHDRLFNKVLAIIFR